MNNAFNRLLCVCVGKQIGNLCELNLVLNVRSRGTVDIKNIVSCGKTILKIKKLVDVFE